MDQTYCEKWSLNMTVLDANITHRPQRERLWETLMAVSLRTETVTFSQHLLYLKRPAPCSSSSASSELHPRLLQWMNHMTPVSCDVCVKCIQALLLNSCLFVWRSMNVFQASSCNVFSAITAFPWKLKLLVFHLQLKLLKQTAVLMQIIQRENRSVQQEDATKIWFKAIKMCFNVSII